MIQPTLKIRALACAFALVTAVLPSMANGDEQFHHVLLLSIDGLHAQDLARYIRVNPSSALAQLTRLGITYTDASTSKPSDSFPGLLSMVTGGSPRSTGVFTTTATIATSPLPAQTVRLKEPRSSMTNPLISTRPPSMAAAALILRHYRLTGVKGVRLSTHIAFSE